MKNDWIALVEAGYDLDGSDQGWLDRLFDRAEPLLDPGIGRGAWTFRCTPMTFQLGHYPTRVSKLLKIMNRAAHAAAPARWFDITYRSGVVVATGTELTYPLLPETMHRRQRHGRPGARRVHGGRRQRNIAPRGVRRVVEGVSPHDGRTHALVLHLRASRRGHAAARRDALPAA